jgi:hypothetical protein
MEDTQIPETPEQAPVETETPAEQAEELVPEEAQV